MTVYHKSEEDTTKHYSKYETFFKGYYLPAYSSNYRDDTIVLGCKTYKPWNTVSSWPGNWPTDVVYGLCMKGWINMIEVWSASGNWDVLFNADSDSYSTSVETNFI
jgi:hypothetical protein